MSQHCLRADKLYGVDDDGFFAKADCYIRYCGSHQLGRGTIYLSKRARSDCKGYRAYHLLGDGSDGASFEDKGISKGTLFLLGISFSIGNGKIVEAGTYLNIQQFLLQHFQDGEKVEYGLHSIF